jgi:GntR family transcriptional regulator, sialic acid-inducible nan operon repressor
MAGRRTSPSRLAPEPIPRRKRSQEVADRIQAKIRAGQFSVGERLPSERVREAIYSLQMMGLIEVSNGERPRVIEPKPDIMIRHLSGAARHLLARPEGTHAFQQARVFFEVGLARHAAEYATARDVKRLREALTANKKAIGQDTEFHRTDVAFHFALAAIPRNPIYTAIYSALVDWVMDQMWTTGAVPHSDVDAYRAHAAITDAIAARDPDAAEQSMRDHLANVSDLYWSVKKSG